MNRNIEPSITEISRPSLWGHQQITLPNGIEIVYLHDPNQEVFKMDVVLSAGIYNQSRPVIASSMINMLNEGTRQHTSAEIAELFDYHGAYVDFNCGMHKAELSLISLNKYASQTIRMLAEMTLESTFPQKELETYRSDRSSGMCLCDSWSDSWNQADQQRKQQNIRCSDYRISSRSDRDNPDTYNSERL